jgi:hypothetical protein
VHGLIAWLVAYALCRRPIDRRLAVIAGLAPDVDGVFVLFSSSLFLEYHHTFGHSFVFGLPLAIAAALLAEHRWRAGVAALLAFSLHLAADIVGSTWAIVPFYPISPWSVSAFPALSWSTIYGIIDPASGLIVLGLSFLVMYRREVSPFEVFSLRLDRYAVHAWIYPLKYRCATCSKRALARCASCGRPACAMHLRSFWRSRCVSCAAPPPTAGPLSGR